MKLRSFIRMSVIVSVVSLCAAFAVFSYLRLTAVNRAKDFNLYTLVPQDALAVVETDRVVDLVEEINQMQCSKDQHFLNVSELFVYLKNYLATWVDDSPHGLSKQMNKMLLSFHAPDNAMNQVLYCALGAEDGHLVESFVHKYVSSSFPPKKFEYEGETIHIYSMSDGRFLSAYFTPQFLVVSFQKRLIEQVIDTYHSKQSLMTNRSFQSMYSGKSAHAAATVYLRMKSVNMGKDADTAQVKATVGCWAEFDLKLDETAIYCTGMSHGKDTVPTFINALSEQKPIEDFSGSRLPASTFFYNCWAISDKRSILNFTSNHEYGKESYSDYVKERDQELVAFLDGYGDDRVMSCLFLPKDSTDRTPCAVMSFPMKDAVEAEKRLRTLLRNTPREPGVPMLVASSRYAAQYPLSKGYQQYQLPRNTLLTQLTGITESAFCTYVCFYKGELLLAPDSRSLSAYIDAVESGNVLEGRPGYEVGAGSLSPSFNYVMMTDMEEMVLQPEAYVRLMPNFFFRHGEFFRHFIVSMQFICTEGVVYPNLVLLYKQ